MPLIPRPASTRPSYLVIHPGAELFGSDRMLLESVRGLIASGASVIVTIPETGPLVDELATAGASVVVVPMLVLRKSFLRPRNWVRLISASFRGFAAALRLIRRQRPSAVYVSTITIPQWPIAARLMGVRSVTHIHEAEASGNIWVNRALYLPHFASQRIIINSRFSLQTLASAVPALAKRTTVVLNGVYSPDEVAPPRASIDTLRILYVGRLSPRKGPDVAIEALRVLRDRGVNANLTILGSPFPGYEWYEKQLLTMTRESSLEDQVEMLGFAADVWPVIAGADVVVVPSRVDEPFGNTAVEAVLANRPVIVSDTSGLREAVDGYTSALSVRPGDSHALADALETVAQDWGVMAAATERSAEQARARHSPAEYRRRVAALVRGSATAHS